MNQLLEEYKYNVIAAETKQYKVLSRDRWAYVFLLMAREVARLQDLLDRGDKTMDDSDEGQLCPYDDCAHDLAFTGGGWWKCPHCHRVFWAEPSDSDYEDYNAYIKADAPSRAGEMPLVFPKARDLGPSWGTPKDVVGHPIPPTGTVAGR